MSKRPLSQLEEPSSLQLNITNQQQSMPPSMCVECSHHTASLYCEQCRDELCENCFAQLHRRGTRKNHTTVWPPTRQQDSSLDQQNSSNKRARTEESSTTIEETEEEKQAKEEAKNFKILHLTINPETIARAKHSTNELDVLRAENIILKDRIVKLELAANESCNIDSLELKEKYERAEKMNQRLKEAFQQQISKFRAGIYKLFGFRVDVQDDTFRIRSQYAEKPDDYLIFSNSGDGIQMLESDYTSAIEPHLLESLNNYHSIPLFLSRLTIELFGKQTVMTGVIKMN